MPRPIDSAITRRILAATRALVAAGDEWTMADVARAAETSRAALYRRFSNRSALLTAVVSSDAAEVPVVKPTRERILDAVEHAIRTRGLVQTTLEQLATDAGVSVASVYRIFKNRRGVLEVFSEERSPRALPLQFEILTLPIDQALELIARGMMEMIVAHAPMIVSGISRDPELQALAREMYELEAEGRRALVGLFGGWVDAGQLRGDPAFLANAFASLLAGWAFRTTREPAPLEAAAPELVRLFLSGCAADASKNGEQQP